MRPPRDVWTYQVSVNADAGELGVEGDVEASTPYRLGVLPSAEPYVTDFSGAAGGRSHPVCSPPRCKFHYTFRLAQAARELRDIAFGANGAYASTASAWLLHPQGAEAAAWRVRFDPGAAVVAPMPPGAEGDYGAVGIGLDVAPYFAFGGWKTHAIALGAGLLLLAIDPSPRAISEEAVVAWVTATAAPVASFFGGFPGRSLLVVHSARGDTLDGRTLGAGGASMVLELGKDVTPDAAHETWVLTHEMVHLALPSIGRPYRWIEEGLATYLEPLIRARAGQLSEQAVWEEWLREMPQGQPGPADEGLDATPTWARTYWGGAIFCLAADVEIRRRTVGTRSLATAMGTIARESGGVGTRWTLDRFLGAGDAATGVPVLRELYAKLGQAPGRIDLDGLFGQLGLAAHAGKVVVEEGAPLSWIRRAMVARAP
jgi:hypothetical protein